MSNMKKKAVMKVGIKTPDDKIDIMKAVAKIKGVEFVTLDGEGKLTVIGEVNPCLIAKKVGKSGKGKTVDLTEVKTGKSIQELNRPKWCDYYRYNNNNCNYDSSYYDCPPRTTYDYCPPPRTMYDCPSKTKYDCPPRIILEEYQYGCKDARGDCSIL